MELVERLRAAGCVFAEDEAALLLSATDDAAELEAMVVRRVEGAPLEYVVGWADFAGHRILLDPGVFVPRPRTEELVRAAVARGGDSVLDLCCGSGAVGLVIARELRAELLATDVDPTAVACARRNGVDALLGDLYEPLQPHRFALVTIVAPYVPTDELEFLPREARLFEPSLTLDGGGDGLDVLRRAIAGAPGRLVPGGWLITEVGEHQTAAVAAEMKDAGLRTEIDGGVISGQYI